MTGPATGPVTGAGTDPVTAPDPKLLAILVCPLTRVPLRYDAAAQELVADRAGLAYPIRDGVPILLAEAAREFTPAD